MSTLATTPTAAVLPATVHRSVRPILGALLSIVTIYVSFAVFIYEDFLNLGVSRLDRIDPAIGGIYFTDLCVAFLIGAGLLLDGPLRQRLSSRPARMCYAFLLFYCVLGLVMGNAPGSLRHDLTMLGFIPAGMAMQRLFMRSGKPGLHLLALSLLGAAVLFLSTKATGEMLSNEAVNAAGRLYDLSIFRWCNFLLPMCGLMFTLTAFRNPFYFLGTAVVVATYFYCGVIVGATRSLALDLAFVTVLSTCSLPFARAGGIIQSKIRPAGLALIVFMGFLLALAVLGLSSTSTIAERFTATGGQDFDSVTERFDELFDAMEQIGFWKILIGPGMGTFVISIFDFDAYGLHIGIFSFLMKFGALPFLAILVVFYGYLPLKFLQALFRPSTLDPRLRTAILVATPGIATWLLILVMSGGYQTEWLFPVGIALGFFVEIKENGLDGI